MAEQKYVVESGLKVLLTDLGVSHANVLKRAQLPSDLFARPAASLTSAEYMRVWHALEVESGDPVLPLSIARAISVEAFNPPIFAALCGRDLNQAARRIQQYKPLIGPMNIDVVTTGDATSITCVSGQAVPIPPALALTELLFWVALTRLATRTNVCPISMMMIDPPADQAPYAEAFGASIELGDVDAITFDSKTAALPFLTENEAMWSYFEPMLRRRLSEVELSASTADRVRAALVELLPAGQTRMQDVGATLAISVRTLQRRLHNEGTSFQAILNTTREALARHYLTNDSISAAQISYLLGFSDPRSFYRAFNDWTGHTPERVRAGAN